MSDREYEIWESKREENLEKLREIERGGYDEGCVYEPLPWASRDDNWL